LKPFKINAYTISVIALMGILDCFTTVVAIAFFGAIEVNPLMDALIKTNWLVFISVKLSITVSVCFLFFQANKKLVIIANKESKVFKCTNILVMVALVGLACFMIVNVFNNSIVLIQLL
jgi:uncharacterized membrane protein